jgi:hypothetical protein
MGLMGLMGLMRLMGRVSVSVRISQQNQRLSGLRTHQKELAAMPRKTGFLAGAR